MASALLLGGCTFHPSGESAQRRSALREGSAFKERFEQRHLAALSDNPTRDDLVRYAMLANADLEQKYWQWRAAIEQIPQDGTPETTLALSAAASVTRGRTGAADTVLTAQNMPSGMIPWPAKLSVAARRALENARAAGLRFRDARFELRHKVLAAYDDYALSAELIRLEQSNAQLLSTTLMVVEARNRAGQAAQQDLLKARNELDLSQNQIKTMQADLPAQLAGLNALLGRSPDAPINLPTRLPATTPVTYSDAQLLSLAARQNLQLASLARDIEAGKQSLELARLQYFPDFALSAGTDLAGITQSLMGMLSVPLLRHEAIDAAITQAQANLRASEATLRQARNDLAARLVLDVTSLRDADRQLALFDQTILPRARQTVTLARFAYETGQSSLLDLLDAQRSLISIQRLVANLMITRDKRLTDLEAVVATPLGRKPGRS